MAFITIKKNRNETNHRYNNNFYSDIQEPNVFYNENDIQYLSNNINNWNQNTYSLPSRQYNNEMNNLNNYSLQSNNGFENNYGFYLSNTSRLRPIITVNNNSSVNNLQKYNNYIQRHIFHRNFPNNYSNRIIPSKSSESFIIKRTNLNDYNNNRSNINIYNGEPFMMKIRPKKAFGYNTRSHDNYKKDDYVKTNYNLEEPYLSQRDLNLYKNKINNIYINRNKRMKKRNLITESNSFPDKMINKNNQLNEKYFKQYNKIINLKKNNINKYFILQKKKGDENNRKTYKKINYENINNSRKRIFNKNSSLNPKKEITKKQEYTINNNIKKSKDNEEKKEIKERNEQIRKKINDFKNHILYISNNKINNKSYIQQKINELKNKNEKKDLIKDSFIKINRNRNMNNDHDRKDESDIDKYIIRRNQKKVLKNGENNENDEGKLKQNIEKHYNSHENFIGGENIIIKRSYKGDSENLIKKVIKEKFNPNVNNLLKKYVLKKEEGKYIVSNQKNNCFYRDDKEPKKIIDDENNDIKDVKNLLNSPYVPNNIINVEEKKNKLDKIEDEDKNRNFTFGIKSDNLRFEHEDKEEKEANEQQISVRSEFEDENEKT